MLVHYSYDACTTSTQHYCCVCLLGLNCLLSQWINTNRGWSKILKGGGGCYSEKLVCFTQSNQSVWTQIYLKNYRLINETGVWDTILVKFGRQTPIFRQFSSMFPQFNFWKGGKHPSPSPPLWINHCELRSQYFIEGNRVCQRVHSLDYCQTINHPGSADDQEHFHRA